MLFRSDIVIDSILDWRDADSLHRANGAEDTHYRPLGYEAKDAPLDTVEELLLIRGVSREIFFGRSDPAAVPNSQPGLGLKDVVTVYPKLGRNPRPQVNAASYQVLIALGATEEEARRVIEYRQSDKIEGSEDLMAALGSGVLPAWTAHFSTSASRGERVFTVKAAGTVPGSPLKRSIRAIVSVRGDDPPVYRIVRWADRARNGVGTG